MKKTKRILRIGIIPAVLISAMLIFQPPGVTVMSLLAAALHECGHLLAAYLLRIPLRSLCISGLGASLRVQSSLISYSREWLLCAAGPFANFLSAFFTYLIYIRGGSPSECAEWFFAASVMLGALNLLPSEGFDGGRMLYCCTAQLWGVSLASGVLSASSFVSIMLLWMVSVYLLIKYKTSLTLFVFTLSLFYRIFINSRKR